MNNKLFVGNISWNIDDAKLNEMFASVGTVVEAVIIKDRQTGRSRGFGFVTMSSAEEAQKAIEELDQKEFDGRAISVSVAQERKERPANGGFRPRY